jgi:FG-GAP repeat protein
MRIILTFIAWSYSSNQLRLRMRQISAFVLLTAAVIFASCNMTSQNGRAMLRLTAPDGAAGDEFGCAVALAIDKVIVGECNRDIGGKKNQGAVYNFLFTGSESG